MVACAFRAALSSKGDFFCLMLIDNMRRNNMSLNRSNFGFDMNSPEFQVTLEKQKQALLDHYHHYYDNEFDELYLAGQNQIENQKVNFDQALLEKTIHNPEILKNYYTIATMEGGSSFYLPYPIEVASMLGLKEMVCHLKNIGHFTPFIQPRLLCSAIRDNDIELVQFYIDCGVSVNVCDVSRFANIIPNILLTSNGESIIKRDMSKYPNYTNQGNYLLIKEGYYSFPPQGKPLCHALFYAIQAGSVEITKLLFESGALLTNLFSHEYESLSEIKKSEEMKALLKHQESPGVEFDLAMEQKAQSTPLQQSLLRGFVGFWDSGMANEKDKNQVVSEQINSYKL
jgi:hypothetical protein